MLSNYSKYLVICIILRLLENVPVEQVIQLNHFLKNQNNNHLFFKGSNQKPLMTALVDSKSLQAFKAAL